MAASEELDLQTVIVEGLQKAGQKESESSETPPETYTAKFVISGADPLSSLWSKMAAEGYEQPYCIEHNRWSFHPHSSKTIAHSYREVKIVADDQPSNENQIRLYESFIEHTNEHYGKPIEFNIAETRSDDSMRPIRSIRDNRGLNVSFQRTLRMPDDDRLHQLPGSLGSCDLFNVAAYADQLQENIREVGGVFFPMWQREAMWIDFTTMDGHNKYALRVFVGRINAVSGLKMDEEVPQKQGKKQQDYVVIPGQEWLDGICVAPGVVRQFVSMPLGSGYTVEGQKTSEEKFGGLQIEVIPEFQKQLRWWSRDTDEHFTYTTTGLLSVDRRKGLNESRTPAQLGLQVGDAIRSYPNEIVYQETVKVKDLLDENRSGVWNAKYRSVVPSLRLGFSRLGAGSARPRKPVRSKASAINVLTSGPDPGQPGIDLIRNAGPQGQPETDFIWNAGPPGPGRPETDPITPKESVESFETTDLKAMGLAAGGKLVQDIYTDPYPADIWNHAAARTIHVHILDPVSCERVTHIVPQPPPISAVEYTEAGGQFFVVEEKVDERVDGGDFDNVNSVSTMDKHIGVGKDEDEFDPMKPTMCRACEIRLCDCIIRPCNHTFCNMCIKALECDGDPDPVLARENWRCPMCDKDVSHVAGFSAPMNLPGEDLMRIKVPVNVLKIEDGRVMFSSVQKTRI